jgi:hypothetical protein
MGFRGRESSHRTRTHVQGGHGSICFQGLFGSTFTHMLVSQACPGVLAYIV